MNDWTHELTWNAIAYAITAGVALLILLGLWLYAPALRKSWFPLPRLRPGAWEGRDVLLAIFIFFGGLFLIVDILVRVGFFNPLIGPAPETNAPVSELREYFNRAVILSSPLWLTVILGLLFAVMFARTRTRPHHYGLSWSRWQNNVALGVAAFVVTAPVVLGIHAMLGYVMPPTDHMVTALGRHGPPWWEWVLMGFQVIVAAPLVEEIVLRGIVQGWLRRASLSGHLIFVTGAIFWVAIEVVHIDTTDQSWEFNEPRVAATLFVVLLAIGYGYCMYRLTRQFKLVEAEIQEWQPLPSMPTTEPQITEDPASLRREMRVEDERRQHEWAHSNALLAVYGSSLLFAVTHAGWPDPVPLFLLALVLGWLQYRTQSLIGPITLHALFNLVAFIALCGSVATAP